MVRSCWYVIGLGGAFAPETLHETTVAGRVLVVWRDRAGGLHALDGRCAHKRFPLAKGRLLEDGTLECAYHGFRYDPEGRCVAVPALAGRHEHLERLRCVARFPVVEQAGVVWVWPGASEPPAGPPITPELEESGWQVAVRGPWRLRADAQLLIENLLDLTHFYPLHAGNIGTFADAAVPVEVTRSADGTPPLLTCTRRRRAFRFGPTKARWFGCETGDNDATHAMVTPGMFRVEERGGPVGSLGAGSARGFVLFQFITPVRPGELAWWRLVCSPETLEVEGEQRPLAEVVAEDCEVVVNQDAWALEEQQRMVDLGDEGFREVQVRTDAPVVMARRLLADLEAAVDTEPATVAQ
jgi:vanillate O-demethylase monooxygenase subunit